MRQSSLGERAHPARRHRIACALVGRALFAVIAAAALPVVLPAALSTPAAAQDGSLSFFPALRGAADTNGLITEASFRSVITTTLGANGPNDAQITGFLGFVAANGGQNPVTGQYYVQFVIAAAVASDSTTTLANLAAGQPTVTIDQFKASLPTGLDPNTVALYFGLLPKNPDGTVSITEAHEPLTGELAPPLVLSTNSEQAVEPIAPAAEPQPLAEGRLPNNHSAEEAAAASRRERL